MIGRNVVAVRKKTNKNVKTHQKKYIENGQDIIIIGCCQRFS